MLNKFYLLPVLSNLLSLTLSLILNLSLAQAQNIKLSGQYFQDSKFGEYIKMELQLGPSNNHVPEVIIFGNDDFSRVQWLDKGRDLSLGLTLGLEDYEHFAKLTSSEIQAKSLKHPILSGEQWGLATAFSNGEQLYLDPKKRLIAGTLTSSKVGTALWNSYQLGKSYDLNYKDKNIGRIIKFTDTKGKKYLYWEIDYDQFLNELTKLIIIP